MKKLQNELKTVSKSLAALTQKVEKLAQQVGKAQPAKWRIHDHDLVTSSNGL